MSETAVKTRKADVTSAVKVKTDLPKSGPGIKTRRYWVGTTPECPIQNVAAGGITFPLFRGSHLEGDNLIPLANRLHGIYIDLTDDHVKLIKVAVQLRVVRIFGESPEPGEDIPGFDTPPRRKKTGQMIMQDSTKNKTGYRYSPRPNDVPLAHFLYMHRLDQMSAADIQNYPPETMAEE